MADPSHDELVFLPLGGSNEIGMNLNAYGFGPADDRRWIVVDVGVTFGDSTTPGVDVIVPDPTYLEGENILGIVLTHAHEDHIGALGWLWPRLKAPLYATPFTAFLIREKLRDAGLLDEVELNVVPLGGTISLGDFEVTMVTITHSIPEPNGLAIKTPLGTVLHTGDWKIDEDPVIGERTDVETIRRLGDEGVLAMVCDSTNVFVDGSAGSEAEVKVALTALIGSLTGKVAVGCFASNVARLDSVIRAAEACGRRVCLVGRSMHRITAAAKSVGLLEDVQPFIDMSEAGYFPDEAILYLCTGSQGEPRAAATAARSAGTPPSHQALVAGAARRGPGRRPHRHRRQTRPHRGRRGRAGRCAQGPLHPGRSRRDGAGRQAGGLSEPATVTAPSPGSARARSRCPRRCQAHRAGRCPRCRPRRWRRSPSHGRCRPTARASRSA